MIPNLKNYLLGGLALACLVLSGLLFLATGRLNLALEQRDQARKVLDQVTVDINAQKKAATAELRTANASVLAQQNRLDAAAQHQEKVDAQAVKTVDDLRNQLRAARAERMRHAAEEARRGRGGAAEQGQAAAGAGAGAVDRPEAAGLLPDPEAAADDDAYDADRLNAAFASCKADAIAIRAEAPPDYALPGRWPKWLTPATP